MVPPFNMGLSSLPLLIVVMTFSELLLFLLVSGNAVSFLALLFVLLPMNY